MSFIGNEICEGPSYLGEEQAPSDSGATGGVYNPLTENLDAGGYSILNSANLLTDPISSNLDMNSHQLTNTSGVNFDGYHTLQADGTGLKYNGVYLSLAGAYVENPMTEGLDAGGNGIFGLTNIAFGTGGVNLMEPSGEDIKYTSGGTHKYVILADATGTTSFTNGNDLVDVRSIAIGNSTVSNNDGFLMWGVGQVLTNGYANIPIGGNSLNDVDNVYFGSGTFPLTIDGSDNLSYNGHSFYTPNGDFIGVTGGLGPTGPQGAQGPAGPTGPSGEGGGGGWIGIAASDLDMSQYQIVNAQGLSFTDSATGFEATYTFNPTTESLNLSGSSSLNIGFSGTSFNVAASTIELTGPISNVTSIQFTGLADTLNITSGALHFGSAPLGAWIGTATSALNMNNNAITNAGAISISDDIDNAIQYNIFLDTGRFGVDIPAQDGNDAYVAYLPILQTSGDANTPYIDAVNTIYFIEHNGVLSDHTAALSFSGTYLYFDGSRIATVATSALGETLNAETNALLQESFLNTANTTTSDSTLLETITLDADSSNFIEIKVFNTNNYCSIFELYIVCNSTTATEYGFVQRTLCNPNNHSITIAYSGLDLTVNIVGEEDIITWRSIYTLNKVLLDV